MIGLMINYLCVFCGAKQNVEQEYKDLAIECGKRMAASNYKLVYGGSNTGLMAAISYAVMNSGGHVMGVYPKLLHEKEPLSLQISEHILVDTLSIRKDIMISTSDAFLILPGGVGTLDELFEILTLKSLGAHNKPIILLNYEGFWDDLLLMCKNITDRGFINETVMDCMEVVSTLEEAFAALAKHA